MIVQAGRFKYISKVLHAEFTILSSQKYSYTQMINNHSHITDVGPNNWCSSVLESNPHQALH